MFVLYYVHLYHNICIFCGGVFCSAVCLQQRNISAAAAVDAERRCDNMLANIRKTLIIQYDNPFFSNRCF